MTRQAQSPDSSKFKVSFIWVSSEIKNCFWKQGLSTDGLDDEVAL